MCQSWRLGLPTCCPLSRFGWSEVLKRLQLVGGSPSSFDFPSWKMVWLPNWYLSVLFFSEGEWLPSRKKTSGTLNTFGRQKNTKKHQNKQNTCCYFKSHLNHLETMIVRKMLFHSLALICDLRQDQPLSLYTCRHSNRGGFPQIVRIWTARIQVEVASEMETCYLHLLVSTFSLFTSIHYTAKLMLSYFED